MSKGISPLIAGVLLVAFTLAIGGLASQFFIQTTSTQTSKASERGDEVVACGNTRVVILTETISYNATADTLLLTVRNEGDEDLTLPSFSWFNSTNVAVSVVPEDINNNMINATNPLTPGELLTLDIDAVTENPVRITMSTQCPGSSTDAYYNSVSTNWSSNPV